MQENWQIAWSDEFISGNKEIDDYHKIMIEGVIELYEMLDDTNKYKNEIPEKTHQIENAMFMHMDIEINYLKRFNLEGWEEHEANHNFYRKNFDFYSNYQTPPLIRAVLTGEMARGYMQTHFFKYDISAIAKINEKLKEVGELY